MNDLGDEMVNLSSMPFDECLQKLESENEIGIIFDEIVGIKAEHGKNSIQNILSKKLILDQLFYRSFLYKIS